MKETIYDEKHITEQAKKITELCNNLTCYSAKDFADTRKFNKEHKEYPLPENGVYVIFEKGETAFGKKRIVRVGTHRNDGRLTARLGDHFRTNSKDGSVFRELVGLALKAKEGKKISDYMRENMSFAIISVSKKEDRTYVEDKIIATLSWWAFFNKDKAHSTDWLGAKINENSKKEFVSEFGMWLSDSILKPPVLKDNDPLYKYLK